MLEVFTGLDIPQLRICKRCCWSLLVKVLS